MSDYIMRSDGPGSIAALVPGAALSHPPTIGSNDPRRNIPASVHGAYPIAMGEYLQVPMGNDGVFQNGDGVFSGGCSGCGMGTNGNGASVTQLPSWAPIVILAGLIGGVWWLKRSKAADERAEAAALGRYYY
jgi:hypothetical protein